MTMVGHDTEMALQVIQTFIDQSDRLCDEIDTMVRAHQLRPLCQVVHKLSGSARTLGAEPLGQLCKSIEIQLDGLDTWSKSASHWVSPIRGHYVELREVLVQFMEQTRTGS